MARGTRRPLFSDLTPREQRLLGVAGGTMVGMLVLIGFYFVWDGLSTIEDRNQAMGKALQDVYAHGESYREKQRNHQSMERQTQPPPSLLGFLDQSAQESGFSIPESSERTPVPRGEYAEHMVDVKLRGVTLGPLVSFLQKVEGGEHLVVTSQLSLRTRFGQRDQMDVEATFSTFQKANGKAKAGGAKGAVEP